MRARHIGETPASERPADVYKRQPPGDLLRRAGIETAYVGIDGLEVTGAHGIGVRADLTPEQMDLTRLDMIVLPGGLGGVASIRGCRQVMDAVRFAYDNGKYVAALCAAPTILAELHITDGREAVCYPDPDPVSYTHLRQKR